MQASSATSNARHLENLTWLRALAAFLVVFSHALRTAEAQYSPTDEKIYVLLINLLDQGSFGVCLFFALSGCTLYLSTVGSLQTSGSIAGFYLKRFMRVWPAFAVSLIIYLVFAKLFSWGYCGDSTHWIGQFLTDYTPLNVLQYLSLTFNLTGPRDLFIGPYWSLPVEFQYYLVLPWVILLMNRKVLTMLAPIVVSGLFYAIYKYSLLPTHRTELFQLGFTFFGGVLAAAQWQENPRRLTASTGLGLLSMMVLMVGLIANDILLTPANIPFISDKQNVFGLIGLFCVVIALFSETPPLPFQLRKLLSTYGDVSYSIYLFHMLFLGLSAIVITRFGIYGTALKLVFVFGFTFVASYFFSKMTYQCIEKPCIDFGKRLANCLR